MNSLLLVEDDKSFGYILSEYLTMNNYEVDWVKSAEEAIDLLENRSYSLVLLDIMLPGMSGFELGEKINTEHTLLPFIFISAKSLKVDQLKGFKLGAYDYITKPVDEELLIAKINALVSRVGGRKEMSNPTSYSIGSFLFLPKEQVLQISQEKIHLTTREALLLELLIQHKNRLLERKKALKKIWGVSDEFSRKSMDVFISHLRKHLSKDPSITIQNVHGKGFILSCTVVT